MRPQRWRGDAANDRRDTLIFRWRVLLTDKLMDFVTPGIRLPWQDRADRSGPGPEWLRLRSLRSDSSEKKGDVFNFITSHISGSHWIGRHNPQEPGN
jgi:hypothetical protein